MAYCLLTVLQLWLGSIISLPAHTGLTGRSALVMAGLVRCYPKDHIDYLHEPSRPKLNLDSTRHLYSEPAPCTLLPGVEARHLAYIAPAVSKRHSCDDLPLAWSKLRRSYKHRYEFSPFYLA